MSFFQLPKRERIRYGAYPNRDAARKDVFAYIEMLYRPKRVLRSVSTDRLIEDRTGESYFLAKVEVLAADIENLEDVRLVPGMPADVMFLNDEQTLIGYLFDPFVQSMNRSFRE